MFAKKEALKKDVGTHPDSRVAAIEKETGISFSNVKIHYASDKPNQFNAHAYTFGNDIYLNLGQEKHLRHELGHVLQQQQGIVHPTHYERGIPINRSHVLETHAEQTLKESTGPYNHMHPIVQCFSIQWDSSDLISSISLDRPPISIMNPRKLFPERFQGDDDGLSESHTTAFVVIQKDLENKLIGLNFIDALHKISVITKAIANNFIGYKDLDSSRKQLIDKKIEEIVNGIDEIAKISSIAPYKMSTNWNALIHHYSELYFICRNSINYTYHEYGNGGGAAAESKYIKLLCSAKNYNEAMNAAIMLFDKNFEDNASELVTFKQHMQMITQFYQHTVFTTGIFSKMYKLSKDDTLLQKIIDSDYTKF